KNIRRRKADDADLGVHSFGARLFIKYAHDLLEALSIDRVALTGCAENIEIAEAFREHETHFLAEHCFEQALALVPRDFATDQNGLVKALGGGHAGTPLRPANAGITVSRLRQAIFSRVSGGMSRVWSKWVKAVAR